MNGTVLAIDPGTSCGWAVLRDGKLLAAGAWNLSPKRHEGGGMRFLRLRAFLTEAGRVGIDAVAYEEVRRHLGTDAAHIYGGIVATITSWCEERGTPYLAFPVATVKKLATGKGNADKDAMIAAAHARWPNLRDVTGGRATGESDAADACWIGLAAGRELWGWS